MFNPGPDGTLESDEERAHRRAAEHHPCIGCSKGGTTPVFIHALRKRVWACDSCLSRLYADDDTVTIEQVAR